MPIYKTNGKTYNIPDDKVEAFEKRYPNAEVEIYDNDGAAYSLPLPKRGSFQKKYDKWSYTKQTGNAPQEEETYDVSEQPEPDSTPETPVISTAKEKPLTEQDKIRFSANMRQMKRRTEQMLDGFSEQMKTMREYQENAPLSGGQTAEGKMQFNPESGKLEKTYITPLGNRYTSKGLADMESFRYRQAADMSVSGQLRRARLKLAELQEKRDASAKRVHEQWEEDTKKNTAPLGFLLAADTYVPRQMSDKENSALDVAIRQTEELIKDLEEQKDREQGVDVGFWRGFGRVAGDFRTWDFGMSDMRDALTMMNADDLKGENATDGEREAYNEMMGALYNKGQAEQMYGGNAGFWNRAGMMTGHMPAFMLDFGITGGGFNGINVLSKAGTKAATKVVGKEVVEQLAEQGFKAYVKNNGVKGLGQYATNWTIKALGTTADDLLLRAPLMTNTVQAGKTTADIIDRKLGDVVVDENGNYDFSNDKTWGNAIWQGEANAIVENYSEMFGSHLDPVVTLGNMSKLANVVGAKRIGAVLSKADAGALNGIMGQTHQLFNKMGVSDYFGEVTEEYYGQLWRTMLNLDDAYQHNPDGTRTNLLATGQFHGDIWGGMALSMGLMGAGKATLSGAQYASMKHGVNKADARATELLGKEIWEPLRTTIDLTTNDDIGSVADGIVNDKNFSDDERAAILTYMERSLMMRGFNLGTLAQKRGRRQDEDVQSLDESYIDGYNIADPQEMTDAKNMYEYQRERMKRELGVNDEALVNDAVDWLNEARNASSSGNEQGHERADIILDYLNAKQVYDGMIQRVRDDIDARVEQSNAMVDARTNRTTGMIQGATMKQDDRRVYVVSGNLVLYADGSGIDNKASDGSIIVRDAETGALEQVSPDAVLNIDEPLNPSDEKMTAEGAIIQQFAQEASDKIDGVVTFNPGDTYTITGDDAQIQVQIVANEDGIVDNGDGTVNVSDGVNIFPLAKETIQQQADAANLARVAQFEQQRTIENTERKQEMQEAERPQYALNDIVSLTDENGVTVRGNITADADADGKYEVFTEAPINGKRVNLFTRDELDNMLLEHNGVTFEHPAENENNNGVENIPENDNNAHQNIGSADLAIPAMQRIPKDEQGNPLYEQADSDTAWDAIVEQTEGDETMAQTVADGMVADKEAALKKLEKTKSKGGNSIAEKIASEKERKAAIDVAKQELLVWQKIAGTASRRKMEADAERRRIADEAAALRKAEEEKLRAEREEAERIEREALNGVPDMVDDKPQDARARGYRRMNGHKIDRQEPVQALMGKEVSVKFSDDAIVSGRISVIDANLLQPSHVQGVRNPLHFIDEAQPKERNDEASVLSARKIAGNIRPEEITSSVTAYTGAPTINARGEVIQGNNRSDALRQMWYGHKDQAEQYKQYLKDHADEFGLRAEDIDSVERPVLVNMLEVDDTEAINLGQFVAQDTESGGIERIKPKNIMQKMGNDMRSFANLLLASSDEETSFAGLVDTNGTNVLKWMMQKGYITPTQYSSAFDSKGNLTAEAKNDLRGIMYQSIFKGGSVRLEEMFNALPVKAQKAILATAFRDYDSPNAERMVEEIQNSIRAYYALSQDKQFTEAKNFKEARIAVESWKHQYQIDDATGESYLPADNFSNFALLLATMYKGEPQGIIQNTFNKIYDLIQGTQEATLFEQPDNTPRTLTQAIYETLNIIYDGQQRSNVLVGDTATSQRGQQGSNGTLAPRERVENRNGTTDDTGRTESIGGRSGVESEDRGNKEEENDETEVIGRSMTADEAQDFIADMELSAEIAPEIDLTIENWDALFGEDGIVSTPIGNVKMGENQFTKLMRQGRNGKLGMIKPTLEHPHAIVSDVSEAKEGDTTERASSYVFIRSFKKADGSRYYYFTSITVSKDGKEVVVSNQEKRRNAIANLLTKGKMVWKHADDVSDASDMAQGLYSPQGNVSDLATEGTDAPQTTMLSDNKGTNNSRKSSELGEKIAKAEAEVDVNPTDKQKEAGNYKKGHVQVGVFDITIEQPKGSVRSGVDANGNKWETTMQNTYGYIRGTEGVDGDHIDVFLSDDIDGWNGRRVFVVDQYNEDGSFDEHKVMLGFNETDDAEAAYFANYDNDWAKKHKTVVTGVNLEDFEKWIDSSHRKTKAFAEYKSVKSVEEQSSSTQVNRLSEIKSRIEELHKEQEAAHGQSDIFEEARIISEINDLFTEQRKLEQNNSNEETTTPTDAAYTITQTQYTTKRGKVLDMHLVKFNDELRDTVRKHTTMFAKQLKGWWDKEKQGFMMRSKEDAERLAEYATDAQSQQPVSMSDMQALNDGNVQFVEPQLSETSKPEERQEYTPVWQYSVSVDKETGLTTLRRDDVSGPIPIGDGRFNYTANSPEEMLEIVRNPKNFNQELRDAVETILENKVKIREIVRTEKAAATEQESKPENNTSGNRLVTDERYAELRERMRKKLLGQMNMGIDPEILAIGTEMAVYHLEKGARKFAEYATAMIADLGDAIRPYLKAFYNGARDLPEVAENGLDADMTPYDEVQKFDVANFDKTSIDALATAETITREAEVEQEAEIAQERIKKSRPERKKNEKKAVNSQQSNELGLFDGLTDNNKNGEHGLQRADAELHRQFAMAVKADMLAALDNGTKPYRSILDLRKRASELGMEVDNDGRTDILLQELVEDGLVRAAREVVSSKGRDSRASYDLICKLYEMQPTIAARSSNRIKMQQYSTPLPMAWIANRFAMANKADGKVLEPTAGNGMLVFTVPVEQVRANELDETRLDNLREQGFAEVTQQDATEPFAGGMQYDVVIANPPFGKREAVEYDGKMIPGLDPQITLNALTSMKDDGRAAIIIGGNMEYASNGAIKSMKPFFTYLYDHYNVKGVIDMSGGLYAKQGTTFPTRMILIDGRRSNEERAQTAVYPPVESKAIRKAESFDDLYEIINEVLNSKEKTNGTEVLRSQGGRHLSVADNASGETDGAGHNRQSEANDESGSQTERRGRTGLERNSESDQRPVLGERGQNDTVGETGRGTDTIGESSTDRRRLEQRTVGNGTQPVDGVDVQRSGLGLSEEPKKRDLTEEKLPYRPHNTAFRLESVAPAAMVEAMDNVLTQIEAQHGSIDEFIKTELGYDTIEEAHQALAAEQMDSVAMAIYQMKQGQALIIGDQTGVGKGRQMAALIRWAVQRGEKPVFITQKADLFSDIYRDLVDIGSGDLVPFIFNSPSAKENKGEMVDANGKVVYKGLSDSKMKKVMETGKLPEDCDFAVLTYSQVNTGDAVSQQEMEEAAKKSGARTKKSKNVKNGKATPKATFLRAIAKDNYLFLDESHTAAGSSNTGAYLQSILRGAKAATFASATFAKRPDTMPLYAIRTAMSQAKVEPNKMISIIEKGGVTLQEIMSRELTNAGQMVRRERDMSDVVTDWKTITDPETVRRARENYDRTIAAFNAIIKFQEDYVKPMIEALDMELAVMAESAGVKRGTDKMGVENVPFASKTYNYTKQLMLALKVDAIADEVEAEINAGRHPVIALESTMESSIKDYAAGETIDEPTFSASLLKGLDTVMQYTVKDEDGNERHERYSPQALGPAGEKAYYELQDFIRESTSGIFISPLDAIIERLNDKGYKVGELTGRNMYVERNDDGRVVVKRRTDKDKKKMQREFNSGVLDVLILNKSASTGISLHASEKFSDQRQRSMIIAQPLSDINDYMQMIGRIDRTGQVHRGYYINLGLPVPAENRFLMMLSTKLKSLNANTTTSQDSESNDVEAPDLLNKYGSQVVVEYLRDNVEIYEKMGAPLNKGGLGGGRVQASELDEYKPQEDDARKVTGYVALLTAKEQEEFYDDVVRRYNELIKYLNDTGSNDLKINVMPLRAKTIERRVSSEGIDPNGSNPFARNSFVEKVEMDVLRKPMKADEIRKVIEQINRGVAPAEYLESVIEIIRKEDEARIAVEEERYEKAKAKAVEDIAKQTDKINGQKKRSEEEKRVAIENFIAETNEKVEAKHNDNILRLNQSSDQIMRRLRMFEVGKSYLVPDNLEAMVFDFATPAIFCGYKTKDSKITASTTLAVFATLDGRRRIEIKLSQIDALRSIDKMTNDNWDAARATTLDNWDSQIPSETRKTGFIMTGNILQAIADTQDEYGGYPGQLISYTDIDGNVHDGILMPDKWNASMLKTSGAPLSSRLQQIKDYTPIISHDGKVEIMGSSWAKMFYLTVPKTKKDGAVYYENKTLLRAAGENFYPYRGKLRADIPADHIDEIVKELTKLGVKVKDDTTDILQRNGIGAYTDDEVSYENDPAAKLLGRSRRTAKQRREFAQRERQRMTERVKSLAEKLHLDNVDIVTDAYTLEGKKQRAKGFYSKSTGKITIVVPNHSSVFDIEQTLLHEAVAHYGLRQLFGEHFDTFLDNVLNNAEESIRRRIVDMAAKNGWDFSKATEEYLASLAEDTEFENINASWWRQIKDFFLNMLHKIGFEDFGGVTLTDNELRYVLWRSYENLAEPGRYRSILGEAADVAKQYELKVGNYAVAEPHHQNIAENDDTLYRDGDSLRRRYDRKVRTPNKSRSVKWKENLLYRLKEAYQDSMSALKTLQDMISEETGNPIHSFENAYIAENSMSAENKSQAEIYERDFYKPMMKVVQKLIKLGASYEELKSYIIAKHGLERNEEFSKRDAEQDGDTWDGAITRDYSGLTELTGDKDNFTEAAQMIVDEFESKFNVSELWDKINAATKETLRKSYNSGLMSKSTYDKVRGMFKYYVPLRGWDCEVASNEYEYMTSNRLMLSPTLKTAEGRTSLADDPLATIGFMAESSIVQGNRNLMKQKFLNFILNNPNELVSISEQWYVLDNATGEWEARNPIIPEDATGDEVASIVEQFEQEMEALGDNATKKKDGLKLSMHITKREGQEHVVRVKRAGKEYCLYINGNPRAAQAINGLTNPDVNDSSLYKAAKAVKNLMARAFTSMNPAFVVSNLSRDIIWAGTAVAIKENAVYTARYNKNVTECLVKAQLPRLLVKYKNGRLDRNNDLERYFDEFIRNGGETGFTQLNTVEDYKRNIKRFIKEAEGKSSITQKAWNGLWNSVEFLNRSAEDTTRFMVYMTSRQMGRDVAHSIYDAKEITVNFNKKGSGGLGASVMNFSYIFFNAAIQSVANFGKLMAKHPAKTTMALTIFSSAGFLVPMMNLAIQALLGGDDDDNGYWDLPEWVRRNNLVLYVPWSENGYMTLPLPHEMRPFYSMGEIAYSVLAGKENIEDGLSKAATGFSSMLPIDLTGNGGNVAVSLTPTIGQPFAQIIANKDYFGKPIYRKHTWNEMDPEWTKAYKSTAPWLVDGTRWLNEITGGNNVDAGTININPALIEHLFESYFGGVGKTLNKTQKTLEMLWNEDLQEWRNVPVISSFYQTADERTTGSQINREYSKAVDEMEDVQHSLSGYKNQVRVGNIEYAEKIDELINSEVFKRYALVKGYHNAIQKASKALKLIDPTQREEVETMIMNLKVEMLDKLKGLDGDK
ncbi:LPD38 domain-containing protein [Phocaeicola sp. ICN-14070]|uniref:LPD38 domain-containing protein n=1 Tax=Phocaeicola sp. ICN-14070 TaxID=3134656 RepID=UPI0030C108A9